MNKFSAIHFVFSGCFDFEDNSEIILTKINYTKNISLKYLLIMPFSWFDFILVYFLTFFKTKKNIKA